MGAAGAVDGPGRRAPAADPNANAGLAWLLRLRWAAVTGQLSAVVGARLLFAIDLPLATLLALIGVVAATNLALEVRRWRDDDAAARLASPSVLGAIMALDIAVLTGLLAASGGLANPFGVFYVVNVALGAVLLSPRWAWALFAVAVALQALLARAYRPLTPLGAAAELGPLALWGTLVAYAAAEGFVVSFVTRVRAALERREQELTRSREREERAHRLQALATLAAGAAHELATPLSTIAIVAKELERTLAAREGLADASEDARLVRTEVARCRAILDRMARDAGAGAGEGLSWVSVGALLEAAVELGSSQAAAAGQAAPRAVLSVDDAVAARELFLPREAVAQALRALVQNGLDATEPGGLVEVRAALDEAGAALRVTIADRGHGMSAADLARAGDPFFTTKEPGRGMGLGLYLARAVVEPLGGRLELSSTPDAGTVALVVLPLSTGPR